MFAVILFDGVCNFCDASVKFVIARDRAGYFRFASLQSDAGQALLAEHGIDRVETDSVVLVENGRAYVRSDAALRIARRLDGAWKIAYAFVVVPRFLRDAAYKLFARNRYRFFGQKDECMLPTPDIRARFIA